MKEDNDCESELPAWEGMLEYELSEASVSQAEVPLDMIIRNYVAREFKEFKKFWYRKFPVIARPEAEKQSCKIETHNKRCEVDKTTR